MFPNGAEFSLSLTFDIEMTPNFPYWTSKWNHRKGAIDEDTKLYLKRMSEIAKSYGVKLQFFLVGSALEDPNIDYLKQLVDDGHAIDNHTYTHVNVKAKDIGGLQEVYAAAPWRAEGLSPLEVIRQEIRQTNAAIEEKLGDKPQGFRTPGGFDGGLDDVPEVQDVLKDEGFRFASANYHYPVDRLVRHQPTEVLEAAFRASLDKLQPYRYPNGLLEIPLMGITSIWAFRHMDLDRWEFIDLIKAGVDHAHQNKQVFSLCCHPSDIAARDPHCDMVDAVLRHALDKPGGCWATTNREIADFYNN